MGGIGLVVPLQAPLNSKPLASECARGRMCDVVRTQMICCQQKTLDAMFATKGCNNSEIGKCKSYFYLSCVKYNIMTRIMTMALMAIDF